MNIYTVERRRSMLMMVKGLRKSSLKWILLCSMIITAANIHAGSASAEDVQPAGQQQPAGQAPASPQPAAVQPTDQLLQNQLVVKKNSTSMIYNGQEIKAVQPLTIKNGTYYVALNGIASPYGYKLSYNVKTRETIAKSNYKEIRFKTNDVIALVNGKAYKGPYPTFVLKNALMIPLRSWAELTESKISNVGKDTVISWNNQFQVPFIVTPSVIYAGETTVTYQDVQSSDNPVHYVDERWEGREDIFMEPGVHTITRSVMDEQGNWSAPYSVTITVLQANQPPVADFVTDKDSYRIGEEVQITEQSTDDENAIVRTTWTGKEKVFFDPGVKNITLEVEDSHGLTASITKTITITDEVLYTRDDYNLLFTDVGNKYDMIGSDVLTYDTIAYTATHEPAQLVRSNSPETWTETGIAYDTQLSGNTRFLFHNINSIGYPVNMYLVATNLDAQTTHIGMGAFGMGGPDQYIENTGKLSTARYLESWNSHNPVKDLALLPGESKIIMPEMSRVPIKPNLVFSAYLDVTSNSMVRYRVVVVPQEIKDPLAILETIPNMARDKKHVRGTFYDADRSIEINDLIGEQPQRLVFGDNKIDLYLAGQDDLTGLLEYNLGNFGVLYRVKLSNVAANTMIGVNARGGMYTGAFLVNGSLVKATNVSVLKTPNEMGVLYRTGSSAESVELIFMLASGSNLPINLTFIPLPAAR
ncbi:stalk domain-containing protein [Paenibacillus solisilvae]|uniref:Stalk domain-containing protein n=1 Tax=Paenibacillus solisilvae TaxID=2486751 RepID=A0ABW0VWD8_9BACL